MTHCKEGEVRDRKTKGCKPRKGCTTKKCKVSPLHQACRDAGSKGRVDLRSLITKSKDIDKLDTTDKTPLMILASQGNVEMIDLFLLNNASISSTNKAGETVLHHANEAAMKKLITYHDAPVNHISRDGITALHHAIQIKSVESVQRLLQHGAHILPFSDYHPNEVQYAMKIGHPKYSTLKALLPYLDKESLIAASKELIHIKNKQEYKKISLMIDLVYQRKFHTKI